MGVGIKLYIFSELIFIFRLREFWARQIKIKMDQNDSPRGSNINGITPVPSESNLKNRSSKGKDERANSTSTTSDIEHKSSKKPKSNCKIQFD